MFLLVRNGKYFNKQIQFYICDSRDELSEIASRSSYGTEAYVIEKDITYILNSSGEWIKKYSGGGSALPPVTPEDVGKVATVGLDGKWMAAPTGVDEINAKIPAQASAANQLADKAFVNSSINNMAAFYITKDAEGNPFDTHADLMAATVFYADGEQRIPTKNDYTLVIADETHTTLQGDPTTRYHYAGNQFEFQYIVNNTALTAEQLAALNSGFVAADKVRLNNVESKTTFIAQKIQWRTLG